MAILRRRFNYAWQTFERSGVGGDIPVFLRCGKTVNVRWLGFIDVNHARCIPNARPVRLLVDMFTDLDSPLEWRTLSPGEFVQGCLVADGVFAVVETKVKLVHTDDS